MKLPDANGQLRSDVSSIQTRSGQSYKFPSFGERQRGPATQTASSASPKQECTELNSHRRDEKLYIKYEPAGRHIADAAFLGVQSHAQCVIAKWPFNQCVHSKKKSEMFTHEYNGKKVRLDNQGDVENSGRWFANLHVQTGRKTVAQALIQIGQIFGIRHIRRAFTESLERQDRARLMADQITPSNRK